MESIMQPRVIFSLTVMDAAKALSFYIEFLDRTVISADGSAK